MKKIYNKLFGNKKEPKKEQTKNSCEQQQEFLKKMSSSEDIVFKQPEDIIIEDKTLDEQLGIVTKKRPANIAELKTQVLNSVKDKLLDTNQKKIHFKYLTFHLKHNKGDILVHLLDVIAHDKAFTEEIVALIYNLGHNTSQNFKLKTTYKSKNYGVYSNICEGIALEFTDLTSWSKEFTMQITSVGGEMEEEKYILDPHNTTKIFVGRGHTNITDGRELTNNIVFKDPTVIENPSPSLQENQRISKNLIYFKYNNDTKTFIVARRILGFNKNKRVQVFREIRENNDIALDLNNTNVKHYLQDGDQISLSEEITICVNQILKEDEEIAIKSINDLEELNLENKLVDYTCIENITLLDIVDKVELLTESEIEIIAINFHFKNKKEEIIKYLALSEFNKPNFAEELKQLINNKDVKVNDSLEVHLKSYDNIFFNDFSLLTEGVSIEVVGIKDVYATKKLRLTTIGGVLGSNVNIVKPDGKMCFIGRGEYNFLDKRFIKNDIYFIDPFTIENPTKEVLKNGELSRSSIFIVYNLKEKKYQIGRRKVGQDKTKRFKIYRLKNEDEATEIDIIGTNNTWFLENKDQISLTDGVSLKVELID
jgi:pSer/pThr/pTyr-binding forkhead associated (FHA) protein